VPLLAVDMEDPPLLVVDMLLMIDAVPDVLDALLTGLVLEASAFLMHTTSSDMLGVLVCLLIVPSLL